MHEQRGREPVRAISARLKVPAEHAALAELVCRFHLDAHRALELRPETVLKLLERLDAFRRPERVARFLLACEADKRGRLGLADEAYPQAAYLRDAHAAARAIDAAPFVAEGITGAKIGDAVRTARVRAIAAVKRSLDGH
jgi:tRNA nucleotidyltransferase (CCA-adding enzyme)